MAYSIFPCKNLHTHDQPSFKITFAGLLFSTVVKEVFHWITNVHGGNNTYTQNDPLERYTKRKTGLPTTKKTDRMVHWLIDCAGGECSARRSAQCGVALAWGDSWCTASNRRGTRRPRLSEIESVGATLVPSLMSTCRALASVCLPTGPTPNGLRYVSSPWKDEWSKVCQFSLKGWVG